MGMKFDRRRKERQRHRMEVSGEKRDEDENSFSYCSKGSSWPERQWRNNPKKFSKSKKAYLSSEFLRDPKRESCNTFHSIYPLFIGVLANQWGLNAKFNSGVNSWRRERGKNDQRRKKPICCNTRDFRCHLKERIF